MEFPLKKAITLISTVSHKGSSQEKVLPFGQGQGPAGCWYGDGDGQLLSTLTGITAAMSMLLVLLVHVAIPC